MRRAIFVLLLTLAAFTVRAGVDAQPVDAPPYLYYYSQLLGGIIIERADGTDSRILGQDVIPANLGGIGGPGWSPSGRFFAGFREWFTDYDLHGAPYVLSADGKSFNLGYIGTVDEMEWAPSQKNILLVIGRRDIDPRSEVNTFFWLIDLDTGAQLAEFGADALHLSSGTSRIIWDMEHEQLSFTMYLEIPNQYFRVTIHFDGTTLREPTPRDQFLSIIDERYAANPDFFEDLIGGHGTSPSGRYVVDGWQPAVLTDTRTNQTTKLPLSTRATYCGSYRWNATEQYILMLNGIALADSCRDATVGVTDNSGELWRELTDCPWDSPACIGWLPPQVDVRSLPQGSPQPIQLDPVRIDYDAEAWGAVQTEAVTNRSNLRVRCFATGSATVFDSVSNMTLYQLDYGKCAGATGEKPQVFAITAAAFDPLHGLLVTRTDLRETGVSVWQRNGTTYERLLRLNTDGVALQFTDDGQYLRSLNMNGWQVWSVDDILVATERRAAAS